MTADQMSARRHLAHATVTTRATFAAATAGAARYRSAMVFVAGTLLIAIVAAVHNGYLFTTPLHEASDEALNGLLITRADHGHQLVGNYSRVGFDHPGPALLYMLAAGQGLFFSWLHVVPAPYNGQLLGASLFGAALLALAAVALLRATRSLAVAGIALGTFAVFALHLSMVGDQVWFPYLYMAPFLLLVVSGSCLAFGRTTELPSFVLALGLLVHGHVSFIGIGGVTSLLVLAGWLTRHRGARRTELTSHRGAVILAAGLVGLFLLPIVLEIVLHFPGPWPQYVGYLGSGTRGGPGSPGFIGWYFTAAGVPVSVTLAAAVAASVLWATSRGRERERVFGDIYAMLLVQTLLFVAYVESSVDSYDAINHYVGFYYLTVLVVLIASALAHAVVRVSSRLGDTAAASSRLTRVAAVVGALVLVVAPAATSQPPDKFLHGFDYAQLAHRLVADPLRGGRVVAIGFVHDLWPQAAGLAIEIDRDGAPWCVSGPDARLLFTAAHTCTSTTADWRLAMVEPQRSPAGGSAIYSGSLFTILAR